MPLILTPFRFYNFRLWTAANAVSVTGTWMQVLAANWLLLDSTGSAAQMGLGVLAHAAPAILLGPWAGSLADRLPARPLLTLTQLAHAAVAAALAVAVLLGGDLLPVVYGAMLVGGVVTALEGPPFGRFGSLLVDRSHLGAALAVGSLTSSVGRIVGMSAGGVLVGMTGPAPLFLANAVSFLVVVAVMYLLRPVASGVAGDATPEADADGTGDSPGAGRTPEPDASIPTTAWAGLVYLLRDPRVLITLGLALLLGSLGRNYQVTMAAMSAGPLAAGPDGYGILSTVFAGGTVVGGLLAARAGQVRLTQLAVMGVGMSVLQGLSGLSPWLWSFAVVLVPIAAVAVVVDTVVATRLQLDNPLALRGRVLGAVSSTGAIAGAIGAPVLGWLSDLLGARGALGVAGTLTVAGSALALVGYAALQRRREPAAGDVDHAPAATAGQDDHEPVPAPRPAATAGSVAHAPAAGGSDHAPVPVPRPADPGPRPVATAGVEAHGPVPLPQPA
ncbi:MAG: MFS transporter [Micromonosporaceae bacterium]|jgi:MFS family permease